MLNRYMRISKHLLFLQSMTSYTLIALYLFLFATFCKGQGNQTFNVGVIIIQGVSLPPESYKGLSSFIRFHFPEPLITATPKCLFDVPNKYLGAYVEIDRAKQELYKHGLNRNGKVFLVGHSLGGVAVQDYAHDHPEGISGLILMGAALSRKYRNGVLSMPVLSINGELDAQFKPIRSAEAYYHQVIGKSFKERMQYPVIILPLLTHMAPSSNEYVPPLVAKTDIRPIVSAETAHSKIAYYISSFISLYSLEEYVAASSKVLNHAIEKTGEFLLPLITSLHLEASEHLKPPCDSDRPSPHCPYYPAFPPQENRQPSQETDCFCGSPTTSLAINTIAGLDDSMYLLM